MAPGVSRARLLAVALASLLPVALAACIFDDGGAEGGGSTRDTGPTSSTGDTLVLVVPDVLGMELADAETRLHDAGLIPATQGTYSEEDPQGTAISQEPEAGSEVAGLSVVVLHVADPRGGPFVAFVIVPEVLLMKVARAESRLEDAGLAPTTLGTGSGGPQQVVVSQNPRAGSEVQRGSDVVLIAGKWPPPTPDVVGMTLKRAERTLGQADRNFGIRGHRYSSTVPKNRVIAQRPAAGRRANPWFVMLVISKGPPPDD